MGRGCEELIVTAWIFLHFLTKKDVHLRVWECNY